MTADKLVAAGALVILIGTFGERVGAQTNPLPNPYQSVLDWAKLPEGRTWGQMAALAIDDDDNLWVTDGRGTDGKGHQVIKFNPEGEILMRLGTAGVAGETSETFNGVAAVAIAPNGDIFVGDGHGARTNARVASSRSCGD